VAPVEEQCVMSSSKHNSDVYPGCYSPPNVRIVIVSMTTNRDPMVWVALNINVK